MFIPLLSLIIGIILLLFTVLIYRGVSQLKPISLGFDLEGNLFFFWGNALISLCLMLGILGYFQLINSAELRLVRLILGVIGLLLTTKAFIPSNFKESVLPQIIQDPRAKKIASLVTVPNILSVISVAILGSIFLIAFCDYNYGGDAFMYHVPFAARLWGIVSPQQYTFEYFTEHRFQGLPLLANFLMGFFWTIFQRIEATNLVAYFSLIILIIYLVKILKIPFYLATLSLLAVPMVHMHAARSYIDLPSNVCISILTLTLYLLYSKQIELTVKILIISFLAAAGAANMKHQMVPIVFLLLIFFIPLIFARYWQPRKNKKLALLQAGKILLFSGLASLLIFATSLKNIVLYQNPFYPVKFQIAGVVLNHTEGPPDFMHANLRKLPPPLRWGRSVLEIDAFDKRRPWPWTLAMDFISWDEERFGLGGYFGGYVIFNLILLAFLCWRYRDRLTKVAVILMVTITGIIVWLPQSYELRYYMFWMIVLVSLNTYLVCRFSEAKSARLPFLKPQYYGLVAAVFMLIFIEKTNHFFSYPSFQSLESQLQNTEMLNQKIMGQIQDGEKACIPGQAPNTFFYSSYFHPSRHYSVRGEFVIDKKWVQEKCQGWEIVK